MLNGANAFKNKEHQPPTRKKNGGDTTSEIMANMHDLMKLLIHQHREGNNTP